MSVKKNFVYSSVLTMANYLFPLLTYPYVSRVLGVTNIGICNYVDSIINYFVLFSSMGITVLGIREIAAAKSEKERLSETFTSLLIISGITTIIALIILLFSIYFVSQLQEYKNLLLIGVAKLIGHYLLIEWFYKGLEEFKYVTNRTIFVKTLYVIAIFVFVRKPEDYGIYFLLQVLMVVVNMFFNICYSRHFIKISFRNLHFVDFIKPFFILGLYQILTSMYTSFNVAYLGFVTNPTEVGYYTTGTKLFLFLFSVSAALTGVMMPRMSSLLSEGKLSDFKLLITKSCTILFSFSIPCALFCCMFSPDIVHLLSGEGYEGAYLPTRIIMPLIFIIGYEQILVIQILMPLKKDKDIFVNSIIGATVGILCNIVFVHYFKAVGSSLVWVVSELTVLILSQYYVSKYMIFSFPFKEFMKNICAYLPIGFLLYGLYLYIDGTPIVRLIIGAVIMSLYFIVIQLKVLKDPVVLQLISKVLLKK